MEITDVLIKSKSGEYDLEMVRRLTISSMKLARIGGLDGCFRLVELSLSRNQIVEIEGLDNLPLLERLDLSWNEIRRARNLAHLQALAFLDLRGNRVADVDDALDGLGGCAALRHLHLKGAEPGSANPCTDDARYAAAVGEMLPQLAVLDGERLELARLAKELDGAADDGAGAAAELPHARWCEGFEWTLDDASSNFAQRERRTRMLEGEAQTAVDGALKELGEVDAICAQAEASFHAELGRVNSSALPVPPA